MKLPHSIQAAAELERRRRHRERVENCYRCEMRKLIYEVYGSTEELKPCSHSLEEQDINSERNQAYIAQIELIYGGKNAEAFV